VFAPFTVIVFGNAKALGFGKGNAPALRLRNGGVAMQGGGRRAQGGLSVGIAYVIGLVNANIAREGLGQIGFPRATKPPLSDELVPC
jgi:hypothetical protein